MKYPDLSAANCRGVDPEAFFIENQFEAREHVIQLSRICGACPVREECAEYAIHHMGDEGGYWGGLTPADRRRIRKARNIILDSLTLSEFLSYRDGVPHAG